MSYGTNAVSNWHPEVLLKNQNIKTAQSFFSRLYDTRDKSWFLLTGKDLMDQTISLFSGTHFTLPTVVLNLGESASVGTGMWISTLLAVERLLNWLFAWDKKQEGQV